MASAVHDFGQTSERLARETRQALDVLKQRVDEACRRSQDQVKATRDALLAADRAGDTAGRARLSQAVAEAESRFMRSRTAASVFDAEARQISNAAWMLESTIRQYVPQAMAHLEREVTAVDTYKRA